MDTVINEINGIACKLIWPTIFISKFIGTRGGKKRKVLASNTESLVRTGGWWSTAAKVLWCRKNLLENSSLLFSVLYTKKEE